MGETGMVSGSGTQGGASGEQKEVGLYSREERPRGYESHIETQQYLCYSGVHWG